MTTYLITGASRGIGRELTEQILSGGDRVAATLRRPEQLNDLKEQHGDRLWTRRLDVTDTAEIERVVGEAFADHGRIDVVVSNAGYGVGGTAEDLDDEHVEGVIATNLTGSDGQPRRHALHRPTRRAVRGSRGECKPGRSAGHRRRSTAHRARRGRRDRGDVRGNSSPSGVCRLDVPGFTVPLLVLWTAERPPQAVEQLRATMQP